MRGVVAPAAQPMGTRTRLRKRLDAVIRRGPYQGRASACRGLLQAIAEGRYTIDPEAIATRMSHFEWQLGS